jgi:putative aldouronate transport system permease protein
MTTFTRKPRRGLLGGQRSLLLMMLPVALYFFVFNYLPMAGLVIAFKDYVISQGVLGSEWNGLENFRRLFFRNDFLHVIGNTLTISLLRLFFGFFAPLILALMINELRIKCLRGPIQSLVALPHYFSWVILGGMFLMLLSNQGPLNDLIAYLGGERVGFLTRDNWFIGTLVVTGIWQSAGYGAIIYLAALSGISPDLYEAAEIDGANRFDRIRHVTLPALVPTIITLFILSFASILNAGFDQIYNLYNPTVFGVADIIDTYVLRRVQTMDFALGTAAGLFKSVVGLILIVTVNSIVRRMSDGEQGVY